MAKRMLTREEYELPLPEQRRLLGLGEGQNPPCPPWLIRPKPVKVPEPTKGWKILIRGLS